MIASVAETVRGIMLATMPIHATAADLAFHPLIKSISFMAGRERSGKTAERINKILTFGEVLRISRTEKPHAGFFQSGPGRGSYGPTKSRKIRK